nr:atherin-like [Camelus dromedarius]
MEARGSVSLSLFCLWAETRVHGICVRDVCLQQALCPPPTEDFRFRLSSELGPRDVPSALAQPLGGGSSRRISEQKSARQLALRPRVPASPALPVPGVLRAPRSRRPPRPPPSARRAPPRRRPLARPRPQRLVPPARPLHWAARLAASAARRRLAAFRSPPVAPPMRDGRAQIGRARQGPPPSPRAAAGPADRKRPRGLLDGGAAAGLEVLRRVGLRAARRAAGAGGGGRQVPLGHEDRLA